jgi:hypothetical protein
MLSVDRLRHVGGFILCAGLLCAAGIAYFLYLRQFAQALVHLKAKHGQKADISKFRRQMAFLNSSDNFQDREFASLKRKAFARLKLSCVLVLLAVCSLAIIVLAGVARR